MSNTYFFLLGLLTTVPSSRTARRLGVSNVRCPSQYPCHFDSTREKGYPPGIPPGVGGVGGEDDDEEEEDAASFVSPSMVLIRRTVVAAE
jgi:hypothetical protein